MWVEALPGTENWQFVIEDGGFRFL
jgi:hypothetical protein